MSYQSGKSIVALIPARAGSQRLKNKNIKPLAGHPLIAYTIAVAKQSGIFQMILVSSDSEDILHIALQMGVAAIRRPAKWATAESPDIEWVKHALTSETIADQQHEVFAILRPTSPFRTAATIRRAWSEFERSTCDCLRAVQASGVNPYKLWWLNNCELMPLLPKNDVPPWHSRPTQTLPPTYQQNASLEMGKVALVRDRLYPSICAGRIYGFVNPPPEGFDINTGDDWAFAEMKITSGEWVLPIV